MKRHYVEVNENAVNATRLGVDYWHTFVYHGPPERFIEHSHNPQGCIVEVACESNEHARWLAAHLVEFGGLPRTAVKAKSAPLKPRTTTTKEHA